MKQSIAQENQVFSSYYAQKISVQAVGKNFSKHTPEYYLYAHGRNSRKIRTFYNLVLQKNAKSKMSITNTKRVELEKANVRNVLIW